MPYVGFPVITEDTHGHALSSTEIGEVILAAMDGLDAKFLLLEMAASGSSYDRKSALTLTFSGVTIRTVDL